MNILNLTPSEIKLLIDALGAQESAVTVLYESTESKALQTTYSQELNRIRALADKLRDFTKHSPPMFQIAGDTFTLQSMLAANAEDSDTCEWLMNARVGEQCPLGGEKVRRVA